MYSVDWVRSNQQSQELQQKERATRDEQAFFKALRLKDVLMTLQENLSTLNLRIRTMAIIGTVKALTPHHGLPAKICSTLKRPVISLHMHQQILEQMDFQLAGPHGGPLDDLGADGLYPCPLCESSFDNKDSLEDHMDSHQQDRGILECDFCGKEFTSKLDLTKHTALHAQESQGDPQCQLCGKYFATREEAVMHLKVHSAAGSPGRVVKQRKFKCERCDRSFFTRKDVKRHMVVHTGQRNFVCQYCPQKFGRKDHLVRHTKKTHTNNNNNNNSANNNNNNNSNNNNNNNQSNNNGNNNNNNNNGNSHNNNQNGLNSIGPSGTVPLSDPGVSSTTGLLPPEPGPPLSPLLPQIMMSSHSVQAPSTPTEVKQEQPIASVFNYGDMSPVHQQQQFHEDVVVPQSPHHLTPLATTSSSSQLIVTGPPVTVLPVSQGQVGTGVNQNILQSGKDPLVSHSSWAPSAYISPSFSSYFIDDENRNAIPVLKHEASSTNTVTTHSGVPSMDFHPSSTSSSYFTLMPIISQNTTNYYNVGQSGMGVVSSLSPLSPTSPQTTTPLTPPLVDGLGSPLPHFSQAFQ
ncbi:zinc finger protein PLAG1-like [Galendromus occidentalis]|uniref:Zinc finger protein PLAG1-like n=1 Tax=Galendromus occidentalis TaxID=34638 RepID=A0AAJ7SDL1_9ACAR|nr:zinc finger protein PLAG1-like [Galendromus occidentalis]